MIRSREKSRYTQTGTFILFLCLVVVQACGPQEEQERPDVPESAEILTDVVFSIADDHPLEVYIESQGIVEPNREIPIRPRIGGFVEVSSLEDGRYIEEGEVLLSFSEEEWRYQLEQAQNEYDIALYEYEIQRRQRENFNSAGGETGNPEDDRMLRINSGLEQAELNLENARLNFSYTTMRASFSGYISSPERVTPGAYISAGTELGKLIDDELVRVRLDVLESEVTAMEEGMPVIITSPSGVRKEGEVLNVAPVVNPESKTGQVVVEVPNGDRNLKPGMTVEGRIRVRTHTGPARIPRAAILERDGRHTIFKLNGEENRVEWVYVDVQAMTTDFAIVESTTPNAFVTPGDTIAVDQHFNVSHLQVVRPRMAGEIVPEDPDRPD